MNPESLTPPVEPFSPSFYAQIPPKDGRIHSLRILLRQPASDNAILQPVQQWLGSGAIKSLTNTSMSRSKALFYGCGPQSCCRWGPSESCPCTFFAAFLLKLVVPAAMLARAFSGRVLACFQQRIATIQYR